MSHRKYFSRRWIVAAFSVTLLLVLGNLFMFRCLLKQSRDYNISFFSLFKSSPSSPKNTATKKLPCLPSEKEFYHLAIVIDDLGNHDNSADKLMRISPQITLSVLPYLPHSKAIVQKANHNGQEILLHLAMEPINPKNLSPEQKGMLRVSMSPKQLQLEIEKQLQELPSVVGVNNHMGSLLTTKQNSMLPILQTLQTHKLFFLDSLTHKNSIAYTTAKEIGIPALQRDVFIDNQQKTDYILNQLEKLADLAKQNGQAIGIGHPHQTTFEGLKQFVPKLESQGIELVKLSQLTKTTITGANKK